MRSGSVYGTAAMLDGMIERMEDELGESPPSSRPAASAAASSRIAGARSPYDQEPAAQRPVGLYQKNKRKR